MPKNTEKALTKSQDQFYSLLQTIDGIVWEADAGTLKFTFVSDYVNQILGYSPKEWLMQPEFWEDHIHPNDRQEALNYYHRKLRPGNDQSIEYRMIKADGSTVWIKDTVSAIKERGKQKWLRGLMQDITAAKRLSNLEHLEKNVLELNSKNDVAIQQVLAYYFKGIEAMFPQMQCSILQVKNNRLYNWASPSLPVSYVNAIENLPISENGGSCGTAAFLKKKVIVQDIATDPKWALYKQIALKYNLRACWSYPIINSTGTVMATLGMYYQEPKTPGEEELKVIDRVTSILKIILENRHQSEVIAETNLLMIQGQEMAQFGNWSWDVQNNIVSWSNTLYDIYGLNKKDFKATFEGYQEMLHPEDRERVYQTISNVLVNKKDVQFEERIIRPNGEIRYLKSWGKLKSDPNGLPLEMVGACLDITESKKIQQELQASESRLRTLADTQTNYINAIEKQNKKLLEIAWMQSHGVRAPLTNIMGLVDLIKNLQSDDIEKSQLLAHLLTAADDLDNIVRKISQKTEHIDLTTNMTLK